MSFRCLALAACLAAPAPALPVPVVAPFVVPFVAPVAAHERGAGGLAVERPVARPNLPGRPMAVYMTVVDRGGEGDRLVGAASPEFDAVELHRTMESEGVVRMMKRDGVEIPPGGAVEFRSGGDHLMLFGARKTYRPGDGFPVTLEFARSGKVEIVVEIGAPGLGGRGTGHGE